MTLLGTEGLERTGSFSGRWTRGRALARDNLGYWRKSMNWLAPDDVSVAVATSLDSLTAASDFRRRRRIARQLAHAAASPAFNDQNLSLVTIERSIEALGIAHRHGGQTEFSQGAAAFLVLSRLKLLGIEEPKLVRERRKKLLTSTGCFAMGTDPNHASAWLGKSGQEAVESLNDGRLYVVGLGADGTYDVSLRLITGTEPMLRPREYGSLTAATPIGRLAPGNFLVGAAEALDRGVSIEANTASCVRSFALDRNGSLSIIFVVCEASAEPAPLTDVPELLA